MVGGGDKEGEHLEAIGDKGESEIGEKEGGTVGEKGAEQGGDGDADDKEWLKIDDDKSEDGELRIGGGEAALLAPLSEVVNGVEEDAVGEDEKLDKDHKEAEEAALESAFGIGQCGGDGIVHNEGQVEGLGGGRQCRSAGEVGVKGEKWR